MRNLIFVCAICASVAGCKNNGSNTSSAQKSDTKSDMDVKNVKDIIVGAERKPARPDFQVLEMMNENDVLTVVFQYSGGCEEHDFNAHFSGGWLKSLPPQAVLDFEHLNPNKDACRSIVKDSIDFDLKPLRYPSAEKVVVKYPGGKGIQTLYEYAN
jgi:hypothetical protein